MGGLTDRIAYARVVILLHLYLLEQCLDPVFWTSIKTCNFVTFYKFLIHLGVHHTVTITVKASDTMQDIQITNLSSRSCRGHLGLTTII